MSLLATSGLSYLNQVRMTISWFFMKNLATEFSLYLQLKKQDHRSKDHLGFLIGLPNVLPPPIKHSFQNYQRTKWPGLENPNAIFQFYTYTYEVILREQMLRITKKLKLKT